MKTCFKCGAIKPIDEFYKHKRMADGHLGKCKTCTKCDVKDRIAIKNLDPAWVRQERARCRIKQADYYASGRAITSPGSSKRWRLRNPKKYKAHTKAAYAIRSGKIIPSSKCNRCACTGQLHKHHPDYDKPLEVEWLCAKCHGAIHRKDQ